MKRKETLVAFGPVWGASGVQGFFGEKYWYQELFARWIPGYSFRNVTFVTKTATANRNEGNMPLKEDGITPKERRPVCIVLGIWQFIWGVMLNAVGLSNIGIGPLIGKGLWQKITEPLMISVMAISGSARNRVAEIRLIVIHLSRLIPTLKVPVAIQLNRSCPNVKHKVARDEFVEETWDSLTALEPLGVPIFVKINTLTSVDDAKRIALHSACSGFIVSNTLPWDAIPKWMRILFFGSTRSPLAHLGGGGLSGWPIRRLVCAWIRDARKAGITKHINAGGGIFGPYGVWRVKRAGADSISLGTIATVRPWMLGPTTYFAQWLFRKYPATRRTQWT